MEATKIVPISLRARVFYDRDLKRHRLAIYAIGGLNLVGAVGNFLLHNWTLVIAYSMWVAACKVWLGSTRCMQITRDRARIADAVMRVGP